MALRDKELIIFDGGFGTGIQSLHLEQEAYGAEHLVGCHEHLNLSRPEAIVQVHKSFFDAGSDVVETNTFGANAIVLAEYNIADKAAELNEAAVENARRAAAGFSGKYIAGSIGPSTKLPSLGQIRFEDMYNAYHEQMFALVSSGVDLLLIETSQDLGQIKIALMAAFGVLAELNKDVPVMLSVTVETTGTLLVGSSLAAVVATVEPYNLFSLGLNCATGPEMMAAHLKHLNRVWPGRISVMPNAGLPRLVDNKMVYDLTEEDFAAHLTRFVEDEGVSIVGGCCGTTAGHLGTLAKSLKGKTPKPRDPVYTPSLSSLYEAVEAIQEIPPLIVGERMNATGSKKFKERLLSDDYDGAIGLAQVQEQGGAHILDVSCAYAGRDEARDMTEIIGRLRESVKLPLVIDSTTPSVIEEALKLQPGRCLINSINLEDGGETLAKVCRLAKRFGSAVIALTINKTGMAMTTDDKIETAKKIHDLAVNKYGLRSSDIFFDMLTFTLGSGDPSLETAAIETLDAIKRIKTELPGVMTLLGVSNISFGLSPASRRILNSIFLHEAIEAGLDAGIVDAAKILPLTKISDEDRELCLDLIYNRQKEGEPTPLTAFIEHFKDRKKKDDDDQPTGDMPPEKQMEHKLVGGNKEDLEDLLKILLEKYRATDILNNILIPAMRRVGELFGRGEMLLPFVLQSAEVMKRSVGIIEPYMEKSDKDQSTKVLLATVSGDVHDIGKNLVDIILSNNGCQVVNLGINVPAETIIEEAKSNNVDVIGLSGLLVKSALVMSESMALYKQAGLTVPILLGGAALTPKFVSDSCVPKYDQPVVYCPDAFAGLKAVKEAEAGVLKSTVFEARPAANRTAPGPRDLEIKRDNPIPEPPFWGKSHVFDIDISQVMPYLNEQALIRGRWGYRRGKMSKEEYEQLLDTKVRPLLERVKKQAIEGDLIQASAAYGYFRGHADGDSVVVNHEGQEFRFGFPRQGFVPHRCISDYFRSEKEGGDVVGFMVVTIGDGLAAATKKLFEQDEFHDYLILHGFGVELTDALAEYWHERMRNELGFGSNEPDSVIGYVTQDYQGSRYGFGYPACPDLELQQPLFDLTDATKIDVVLTENFEMVPEFSTSAIVVHHPQAKYFAV